MKRFMIGTAILLTWAVALAAQPGHNPRLANIGQGPATEALFDLNAQSVASSPFPSNWYTVPDPTQNTGLRVNLPKPNCDDRTSDCEDLDVINELDGFNIYPRLSVPFNGPIDLNSVSGGVFLIRLGSTLAGEAPGGKVVGIDQVVFESSSNTLYVQADALLDQHTRYLLVVTKDVLDEGGKKVKAAEAFLNFVDNTMSQSTGDPALDAYRTQLRGALEQVDGIIVPRGQVVAASVFTTQSATAILEKIRDQIHAATPSAANFLLGPNGERTVFRLNQLTGVIWNQQKMANPAGFNAVIVNLSLGDSVDTIAFGKYISPDYQVHPFQYIPPVGTRSGTPAVKGTNEIYFNLFLPSGSKPVNGWPLAIYVHGVTKSKDDINGFTFAASMAKHGIATIAINDVGHGFGPLSTLTVSRTDGAPISFYAGGRGIDQDANHKIIANEGIAAARPEAAVFYSDGYRQTAADLMQLVRVIEVGMDPDGDGHHDLDPSRIYLFAQSMGGGIGTIFAAVEPDLQVGVISVPFDPIPGGILSCANRNAGGTLISSRQPSLLNSPGIKFLNGCQLNTPFFDEDSPLKGQIPLDVQLEDGTNRVIQSPVTNAVVGAVAIQDAIENLKWVGQAGSPLAYAPHLRKVLLESMSPKPMLIMTAYGDQTAPNPTTTAIIRAGDMADRNIFYRHDLYCTLNPCSQANPHGFAVDSAAFGEITLDVQEMVGRFFQSDGITVIIPVPSEYFEFPITELPESLNYNP